MTRALRHRYGRAGAARTFGTYEVLAGAYTRRSPASLLSHTLERGADGQPVRVLCKRVKLENLADEYSSDVSAAPTCPICLKRDPRFQPAAP